MRIDFPASCLRDHLQGDIDEGNSYSSEEGKRNAKNG
jgi:hypothetical protein